MNLLLTHCYCLCSVAFFTTLSTNSVDKLICFNVFYFICFLIFWLFFVFATALSSLSLCKISSTTKLRCVFLTSFVLVCKYRNVSWCLNKNSCCIRKPLALLCLVCLLKQSGCVWWLRRKNYLWCAFPCGFDWALWLPLRNSLLCCNGVGGFFLGEDSVLAELLGTLPSQESVILNAHGFHVPQ